VSDTKTRAVPPEGREPEKTHFEFPERPCCRRHEKRLEAVERAIRGGFLTLLGFGALVGLGVCPVRTEEVRVLHEEVQALREATEGSRRDLQDAREDLLDIRAELRRTARQVDWTGNDVVLLRETLEAHFCTGRRDEARRRPCPFPLPALRESSKTPNNFPEH